MKTIPVLLLALLCCTAAVHAQSVYSDTYVIPIVGHTTGAGGRVWMSDVAIRNFDAAPLTVQLVFIQSGDDTSGNIDALVTPEIDGSVTLHANETLMLRDILDGYGDMENVTGALLLGADRPFAVTSRAYNSDMILGQTVPATRDFLESSLGSSDNGAVAYLPGIVQNDAARTNVGFVAGSGGSTSQPMVVEITIRNDAGAAVGTKRFTIAPGAFAQMQTSVRSITSNRFDTGTAEVRIVSGEGAVVPYASVVDNRSGEAAYIMGQFPDAGGCTNSFAFRVNVFRSLLDRMVR